MRGTGWFALLVIAGATTARAGEPPAPPAEMPMVAVERALRAPPATGLLVVAVAPGTQATGHGIAPGSVLTRYGDTDLGSLDALREALARVEGEGPVEVSLVAPDGRAQTLSLRPGPIGIADLRAVEAGVPTEDLPEDSGLSLSFASLPLPCDEWYRFTIDGAHVGFEHGTFSLSDALLRGAREVAFDGKERWGLNHMAVEVELVWGEEVEPSRTLWTNVRNGWFGEAHANRDGDTPRWEVAWHHAPDSVERFSWLLPEGLPIVPSYLVEYLARALPHRAGACLRYRPMDEGMGRTGLPCALVVVGEETIDVGGESVATWRVEQRQLGATQAVRYWVDSGRRARRIEYGPGVSAEFVGSREEAVAGLPETLRPKATPDR